MSPTSKSSKVSGIKVALAVVPALLIVSICIALYLGATADREESRPYEGEVTVSEVSGYLKNLNEVIGERRIDTEEGKRAFRQINAMTMGALGPENLGYEVFRIQQDSAEGLLWPTIWVDAGDREADEVIVVAIPQDEGGTGPAFAYGLAEYLASHPVPVTVRIVFYPPLVEGDLRDWLWKRCGGQGESLEELVKVTGGDPDERRTVFGGPPESEALQGLSESKLWGDEVVRATGPLLEVRLPEQGGISRDAQARRLIAMMPLVKELLDRLGR